MDVMMVGLVKVELLEVNGNPQEETFGPVIGIQKVGGPGASVTAWGLNSDRYLPMKKQSNS
jgi:hypothetical protein